MCPATLLIAVVAQTGRPWRTCARKQEIQRLRAELEASRSEQRRLAATLYSRISLLAVCSRFLSIFACFLQPF